MLSVPPWVQSLSLSSPGALGLGWVRRRWHRMSERYAHNTGMVRAPRHRYQLRGLDSSHEGPMLDYAWPWLDDPCCSCWRVVLSMPGMHVNGMLRWCRLVGHGLEHGNVLILDSRLLRLLDHNRLTGHRVVAIGNGHRNSTRGHIVELFSGKLCQRCEGSNWEGGA